MIWCQNLNTVRIIQLRWWYHGTLVPGTGILIAQWMSNHDFYFTTGTGIYITGRSYNCLVHIVLLFWQRPTPFLCLLYPGYHLWWVLFISSFPVTIEVMI